ncbi:unnamed protein product [Lactuca saligna]|uniref:H(+)-transporting two-sector ATPase n=1 Tax=Lactuca saligna TaxID=75948 RepID=A0AA35ZMG4_LACSI|nr:unnamed protein product [Lactuca saligna]
MNPNTYGSGVTMLDKRTLWHIAQIIGLVLDVPLPPGKMPNIYNALVVKGQDTAGQAINVTCEDLKYPPYWVECLLVWVINLPLVPKWVLYKKELLLPNKDATTILSSGLVAKGIYPTVDPLDSMSTMLQPWIVGEEHYDTAQEKSGGIDPQEAHRTLEIAEAALRKAEGKRTFGFSVKFEQDTGVI